MNERDARAEFDSWMAAQYFREQRQLPDREMLRALVDCPVELDKEGDCERLQVTLRTTIGEVARKLLTQHYGGRQAADG